MYLITKQHIWVYQTGQWIWSRTLVCTRSGTSFRIYAIR